MKIEFYPSSKEVELVVPPPRPAAYYIPEWYKKTPKFSEKNPDWGEDGNNRPGVKSCAPFLDAYVNGYIQETWQDIRVRVDDATGRIDVDFPTEPDIVSNREKISIPVSNDFYDIEFIWKTPWIPRTPEGWSIMFAPLPNRLELPFTCATGIIDSDNFYHSPFGNFPFYIRKGFRGIIPKGTPMFQMIPIKRESWQADVKEWDRVDTYKRQHVISSKVMGAYRKLFWVKKEFS